jgi:YHS domain-containing protein
MGIFEKPDDEPIELNPIEKMILENEVPIADHVEKDVEGVCGYCGQYFAPDEVVIEKTIHGRKWHFCSDQCYTDFKDASDFKDEVKGDDDPTVEFYDQEQDEKDEF